MDDVCDCAAGRTLSPPGGREGCTTCLGDGMKRRMAAMTAVLAAGIGMAGTASVAVAAPGTASASTPTGWKLTFQSPRQGFFGSIAAVSKTNVWAVADLFRGGIQNPVYTPYIRHFNGSTWTA